MGRSEGIQIADGAAPSREEKRSPAPHGTICIHHGGRAFRTTTELAGAFLKGVQRLLDRDGCELVPLLHLDGVDLLLIGATTPLTVHDASEHARAAADVEICDAIG